MKTIYQQPYAHLISALILARKNMGFTQADVAKKLGKPQSYIAKIEGKDRKIDVVEFVNLCRVLNIKASETIQVLDVV